MDGLNEAVGRVFREARNEILAAGLSIFETIGDTIYEVFPDGHVEVVKKIEPSTKAVVGTKIEI